ncbi:SGNH hydrolase [Arthrobacter sp. ERGS1:01]|uniref:SGNH/GDSL hydrolase family protein n=1 Tax=Arthrobacter sp. ERGS1:01 TaxID=1704044 RepID=UPI0006B58DA2|nr:SGNH/GDSL hydrolase family protein [Arthrobacter sp. ERGS1:01]ALE07356.1 SGNH hydrolase [Arthrobacter sp. ERGS1:01]
MEFSARYVALGDSFTEGLGDTDASLPNQVRGWADRAAEQLALHHPDGPGAFGYANLAIRGKKMKQILSEQVDAAVAMNPTLVTSYAGINDILRPKVDIDAMVAGYGEAIGKLRATGARVLIFTGFDASSSKVFAGIRGRTAVYNELVREVAELHGAELVDYWRFREYNDWRLWGVDRMHMSTPGHINMANHLLETLGESARIPMPELPPIPVRTTAETLKDNAAWTKEYVGPWISRRLRGVSSGDNLDARWPELRSPLQQH